MTSVQSQRKEGYQLLRTVHAAILGEDMAFARNSTHKLISLS
jgi:hypothetical protein